MKWLVVIAALVCHAAYAAPDPPDEDPCNETLYCWTCDCRSNKTCWIAGKYEQCPGPADENICFYRYKENGNEHARGCMNKSDCPEVPYGDYDCTGGHCTTCYNGPFLNPAPRQPERRIFLCEEPDYDCCFCKGDPHCSSFDCKKYWKMDAGCWHILVQDNCTNGLPSGNPTFQVSIQVDEVGKDRWAVVGGLIETDDETLELGQDDCAFSYNSGPFLPDVEGVADVGPFTIDDNEECQTTVITFTDCNITVHWDFFRTFAVCVPKKLQRQLCGICGNYDGDSENLDYINGPSENSDGNCDGLNATVNPAGSTPLDENSFMMTWYKKYADDEQCKADCE